MGTPRRDRYTALDPGSVICLEVKDGSCFPRRGLGSSPGERMEAFSIASASVHPAHDAGPLGLAADTSGCPSSTAVAARHGARANRCQISAELRSSGGVVH